MIEAAAKVAPKVVLPRRRTTDPNNRPNGRSLSTRLQAVRDGTLEEIDRLVGSATPQFAYQLRARIRELIEGLPPDNPTRRYGEEKMELLDRLGHASSKAEEGPPEPRTRIGWDRIPSSAPASDPLPSRR
jgi:hypothetical protein